MKAMRKDRLLSDKRHDTYRERSKHRTGTVCSGCGAVYEKGRWTWKAKVPEEKKALCPACLRTTDRYPAGTILIGGQFFNEHRREILNLVRNVEKQEKGERPLERIMGIQRVPEGLLVTTTGVHVARRIGEALERSYQGDFSLRYDEGETSVRIQWTR